MAVADRLATGLRTYPKALTALLSVVGYVLVGGALYGFLPLFPPLSDATVELFSHLIAAVNAVALVTLLVGWRFIRRGEVRKHRAAMLTAFTLILGFLVLYLWKTGGGYEQSLVAPDLVRLFYLPMLFVHIALSVAAVPVVLYAVILGLTHTPAELRESAHPRVGRLAVAAWSLSLALGLVTYLLLNVIYEGVPREEALLLLLAGPAAWRPT